MRLAKSLVPVMLLVAFGLAVTHDAGGGLIVTTPIVGRLPKPPRGTGGLASAIGLNPRRPAASISGIYKGALVIGGQMVGSLRFTMSVQNGATVEAPVTVNALGWSTDLGIPKTAVGPQVRVKISAGLGAGVGITGMSLGKSGGETTSASLAALGRYIPAGGIKGPPAAFVMIGELRFAPRECGSRFGGQDMGDFFGGQDMGDFFGGQDMGDFFGGQDMGSYFGGQDMGSYLTAEDIATYLTGASEEFGGQDMGSYFGGQDMGDFLTARGGALRVGVVLLWSGLAPIPRP